LINQLYNINDTSLNTELLDVSDDLSDLSLYRGAEVITAIDINANDLSKPSSDGTRFKTEQAVTLSKSSRQNTRVHRLVTIQRQLNRKERSSAIDTLHDLDSKEHRKAAIDLGFYADKPLLADSIAYTENLRFRLGHDDGLDASKRLIVLASRINENSLSEYDQSRDSQEETFLTLNKARQAGLDALQNERESRVRQILKQTTKESDVYGNTRTYASGGNILRIISLYRRLDSMEPKSNPFERTRAAELADALSSSDGITLGPSGLAGVSRVVTQETKIRRMNEYLSQSYSELWNRRVIGLTDRPILVSHRIENEFEIPDPENIKKDTRAKPQVVLIKPKSTNTGF